MIVFIAAPALLLSMLQPPPIAIGSRVRVVQGAHNVRATPDSTAMPLDQVQQDAIGTVLGGPTKDTSGVTAQLFYNVDWTGQTVTSWIVGTWLVEDVGALPPSAPI